MRQFCVIRFSALEPGHRGQGSLHDVLRADAVRHRVVGAVLRRSRRRRDERHQELLRGRSAAVRAAAGRRRAGRRRADRARDRRPEDEAGRPPIVVPMTYRKLLEVTHFHLFTMPVVLLIIGHLFLATGLGDRAKLAWLVAASASVAAHLATPWIVRYGGGRLAFLHAITGIALTLTMSVLTIYPVLAMWRGDRSRNSGRGSTGPTSAARAPRSLKHSRASPGRRASHRYHPTWTYRGMRSRRSVPRGRWSVAGFHCWRVAAVRRRPTTRAGNVLLRDENNYTTTASLSIPTVETAAGDRPRHLLDRTSSTICSATRCRRTADLDNVVAAPDLAPVAGAGRGQARRRARCRSPQVAGYLDFHTDHSAHLHEAVAALVLRDGDRRPVRVHRERRLHVPAAVLEGDDARAWARARMIVPQADARRRRTRTVDAPTGCGLLDFSADLTSLTQAAGPGGAGRGSSTGATSRATGRGTPSRSRRSTASRSASTRG